MPGVRIAAREGYPVPVLVIFALDIMVVTALPSQVDVVGDGPGHIGTEFRAVVWTAAPGVQP